MTSFTSLKNWMLLAVLFVSGSVTAQTNLLSNAGFEEWEGGKPVHWVSTTSAGNATVSQSDDALTGSSSVLVKGTTSSNKRLAYEEITLKPGTYTFSINAKAATAENASCRPGYAPIKEDGTVDGNGYKYADYVDNITNAEWVKASYEFTLEKETKVNLVVMNPKKPGKDLLLDDASLTTTDGGIVEGGGEPVPVPTVDFVKAEQVASGKRYAFAVPIDGIYKVAQNVKESYKYGFLSVDDVTQVDGVMKLEETNTFTMTAVDGGYTIQDSYGRYLFMDETHNSFNVSAELPAEAYVWTVALAADGKVTITNVARQKWMQYSEQYKSYGAYPDEQGLLPELYIEKDGSSVGGIEVENNSPVEVYTLGGVKVGDSLNGLQKGIYIVKQGQQVKKVVR